MNLLKKYKINPFILIIFLILIVFVVNYSYSNLTLKYNEYKVLSSRVDRGNDQYNRLNKENDRLEEMQERYQRELAKTKQEDKKSYILDRRLEEKDIVKYLNEYSEKYNIEIFNFNKNEDSGRILSSNIVNLKTKSDFLSLVNFILDIEVLNERINIDKINISNTDDGEIQSELTINY